MDRKFIYLDVDGVLLGKNDPRDMQLVLANHTTEFLSFCLDRFDCYWLTTHCRNGDAGRLLTNIERMVPPGAHAAATLAMLRRVKPTSWQTLKTEAIDFESDFFWVDDSPLQYEIEQLKSHGVLDRWIRTDTRVDPDGLKSVMERLKGSKPRIHD